VWLHNNLTTCHRLDGEYCCKRIAIMSGPNQIRPPLALRSANPRAQKERRGKKQAEKRPGVVAGRAKQNLQTAEKSNQSQANEAISYRPYTPLGPRIEHHAQALLPWEDSEASIVQIFELFWDERVVESIVQETNAYATEKRAGFGGGWKKVRGVEIRLFLALLIHMGARRGMGSQGFWQEVCSEISYFGRCLYGDFFKSNIIFMYPIQNTS